MTTERDLNLLSNPDDTSEDRGPLIEDEELDKAKEMVEENTPEVPATSDDVLAFLESEDDDDIDSSDESYIDNRVAIARDIRPMLAAWHEYKGAMSQVKASYKLWKVESELDGSGEGQDQRKEALVQQASLLQKSVGFIEGEIKKAFHQLQGVAFLTRSELLVLPIWMHQLLNVTVEATDLERAEAQANLQKTMEDSTQQE